MSKLTFRAKALEHSRKMAIYIGDEIPELTDFAIVNRTVPEMPSGMEKEEETQHHLQKALSAQQSRGTITNLIIPTPDMRGADQYERIYSTRAGFTASKKFVHVQPTTADQELPDYDMDTEDELWLGNHESIYADLDSDPIRFENMVDKLEKGSGHVVVKLNEAKALIKEKEEVVIAVYDYWLNKRLRQEKRVKEALALKLENMPLPPAPPSSTVNPYLAFRKRAEKMQTRKNRKNDEQSYLGILQLRKSFEKAKQLLKLLKLRESNKRELVETKKLIFEKRHELKDWTGDLVGESEKNVGPVRLPDWSHLFAHRSIADDDGLPRESHALASPTSNFDRQKHDPSGANEDGQRPRKRRKKHHKRSLNVKVHHHHLGGGGGGGEVASEDADDDLEGDEVKASRCSADDDELDMLSRTLSFFDPGVIRRSRDASPESVAVSSDGSEDDDSPDGRYAFKRREGCFYEAPIPFGSTTMSDDRDFFMSDNRVFAPDRFQAGWTFAQATLREPPVSGLLRRRVGRGGRVVIDRLASSCSSSPWDHVGLRRKRERTMHDRERSLSRDVGEDGSTGLGESAGDRSVLHSCPEDLRNVDLLRSSDSTLRMPVPPPVDGIHDPRLDSAGAEAFPDKSCPPFLIDPTSCTGRDDAILSVSSSSPPVFPSDKATVRMSRVSFLLGSTFPTSGYKRKCSNRTDSEDSGVCSPSPTPSAGSLPGGGSAPDRPDPTRGRGTTPAASLGLNNNLKNRISPSAETDDGISDDHSMNGDSCSSFSDHRVKTNSSENGSDRGNYTNEASIGSKKPRMETTSEGSRLIRKHLPVFDDGKFSVVASKMMIKDGALKSVGQTQVGTEISGMHGEGLRFQCQMKLSDINNLISMNGEVATALEVS